MKSSAILLALATLSASAVALAAAGVAGAHTCGDNWCSGSDSGTRYNAQGNDPQIYMGEVGVYYLDIGGSGAGNQPCPADPNNSCFNLSAANAAYSKWNAGTGMGVMFYYFGGGAASQYEPQWGSPYCFGWHQGKLAVADANKYFSKYYSSAWLFALDIEQNNSFGWSNQTQHKNQEVEQGFDNYIDGVSSADPSNCTGTNTSFEYQHAVYSSPAQWSYSFGSSYGSIPNTPEWTSEWCCHSSYPQGFGSGSTAAQWFGGSNYHDMWQFNESPDQDNLFEPVFLPHWGFSIGS